MSFDFDFIGDLFSEKPARAELQMEGSLKLIRMSKCGHWALIKQPVSLEEKWVNKTSIQADGAMIAFYDADPTFLPQSERCS